VRIARSPPLRARSWRSPGDAATLPLGGTAPSRFEEATMAICEVCGNDYYLSFQVVAAGTTHTFDSFECAIHRLAPVCEHCHCRIIGHGIEAQGTFYCCAHCAREQGVTAVADHAP
jgi:hypothetical protein